MLPLWNRPAPVHLELLCSRVVPLLLLYRRFAPVPIELLSSRFTRLALIHTNPLMTPDPLHKNAPLISYTYVRIPIKFMDLWLDFVCTGTFGIQGWSMRKTDDFGLYVTRGVLSGAKWSFDKKGNNRRFNSAARPQNETAVSFQKS